MEQKEMNDLDKVVQLVDKAGCTYADAKDALEKSEWNLLDAIILLEQEGKAAKSSASCKAAEPQDAPKSGSYEEPEVISAEDAEHIKPEEFKQEKRGSYGKGNFGDDARHYTRQATDATKGFFAKAKAALTQNYMTVLGRSGNQILHLPLWVMLILLLCWFWGVMVLALVMMVFGCRFHFEGRDFGRININDTFDRASQKVYETGQKVHDEFSGKKNDEQDTDH
jgi:hypothetical protein